MQTTGKLSIDLPRCTTQLHNLCFHTSGLSIYNTQSYKYIKLNFKTIEEMNLGFLEVLKIFGFWGFAFRVEIIAQALPIIGSNDGFLQAILKTALETILQLTEEN